MTGVDGHHGEALPHAHLQEVFRKDNRLTSRYIAERPRSSSEPSKLPADAGRPRFEMARGFAGMCDNITGPGNPPLAA
jgi:hypothetical protein